MPKRAPAGQKPFPIFDKLNSIHEATPGERTLPHDVEERIEVRASVVTAAASGRIVIDLPEPLSRIRKQRASDVASGLRTSYLNCWSGSLELKRAEKTVKRFLSPFHRF